MEKHEAERLVSGIADELKKLNDELMSKYDGDSESRDHLESILWKVQADMTAVFAAGYEAGDEKIDQGFLGAAADIIFEASESSITSVISEGDDEDEDEETQAESIAEMKRNGTKIDTSRLTPEQKRMLAEKAGIPVDAFENAEVEMYIPKDVELDDIFEHIDDAECRSKHVIKPSNDDAGSWDIEEEDA
jgi:hypothetical protein